MATILLHLFEDYTIRDIAESDLFNLARYANNRNVWVNLRDTFPHPYTEADAAAFYKMVSVQPERDAFAICKADELIGGIGYHIKPGTNPRAAEIGFWLGEPFWGRGIATAAANAFTARVLADKKADALFAYVFSYNTASCRALEKCGFKKKAFVKDGELKDGSPVDLFLYTYGPVEAPGTGSGG